MLDRKTKVVLGVAGLLIAVSLIVAPADREKGAFTQILESFGRGQEELSNEIVEEIVEPIEGSELVPDREDGGKNWSIPEILRRLFGVE